ncbi:CPBP family intramembrane glutamic endopeptidase [Porphyromonas sp.]|uniref:CPBP family intramembrane glutamic endopeptidase n=1 Tax=Porphyromonas sp. TaxID=1924944 RepID=UPI0026DAE085|nr:CPBP family intramembrane glutamic endopeptidase [Porphyromonas sp.]MDO4770740.1 CPBP family intramembrane metalloprotease [Porphyromonas sp.]
MYTKTFNTQHSPSGRYILSVFLLFLFFQVIASVVAGGVFMLTSLPASLEMALTQTIVAICTYIIPPILNEYYYRRRHETFVFRDAPSRDSAVIGYSLLLFGLSYVIMMYSADMNFFIGYPEWLGGFGEILQELETKLNASLAIMLSDKSPATIFFTFLSIVVIAPVGEELLFRGALQGWLTSRTKKVHFAVFLTAIIFSAVHMQWSGFIPRVVMGVLLGYVAVYGSLRLAILIHALNNLLAYILFWTSDTINEAPEIVPDYPVLSTICMLVSLGLCIFIIKKMRNKQKELS